MIQLAPIIARILATRAGAALAGGALRGGAAEVAAPPVQSFAALAATGKNFGDLLSQKVTPAQVNQRSQQDKSQPTPDQAAGNLGSRILGAPIAAMGGATGVAAAFAGITIAGKKLAEVMVESQRQFAKFNGQIAYAVARLTRGDLLRSRATAAATAGTTDTLVSAVNEMRNELRPLKDVGTNILNTVGAGFAKLVTYITIIAKHTPIIAGIIERMEAEAKKRKGNFGPWQQQLNELAARSRARRERERGAK